MSNSINYEEVKSIYDSIKELYISYCQNLDSEKKKLEQIVDDIKETKDYITYLENHQKSDAFVFSPRGVISKNNGSAQEGKYDTGKTINFSDCEKKKEELLTLNNKKKDIESEIDKLQSVVVLLEKNKNILKDISNDKDSVETEDKQCSIKNRIEKGPVENLNYLSHIVNVTQTYIDSDPMRAKLELKTIETNINSIAEELMQIVKIPEDNN